ncbi:MAG: class I SAM-dependent methyltransferase [Desulfobacterales bacterium]|nr:class I SAM-dependent methyltransferase [Desulfobacterales bacterium]
MEKEPIWLKEYYYTQRFNCSFRKLAARTVSPGTLVLDAGCGKRSVIGEENLRPGLTIGAEFSREDIAANSGIDSKVVASLENLPFKNEVFDIIICRNVVEHLENPGVVFWEFRRIMKTGALVLIRTPNLTNPIAFTSAILPLTLRTWIKRNLFHDEDGDTFPTYFKCNTATQLASAFGSLGMRPQLVTHDGLMAYFNFSAIILSLIVLFERVTDIAKLRWLKMWIIASFEKDKDS